MVSWRDAGVFVDFAWGLGTGVVIGDCGWGNESVRD